MPGRSPPALAAEAFTARGFPASFPEVFAGARFRDLTAFLTFFGFTGFFVFALTVGFPLPDAREGRVHFRLPRAFA